MSDVKIYGPAPSSYVWTARFTCNEKGIAHELVPIEFGSDEHKALHPFGRVPIMDHGAVRLYETAAITTYIDEAFDGPPLRPADPAGRGLVYQWISSVIDYYYDFTIRKLVFNRIVKPMRGVEGDEQEVKDALPHVRHLFGVAGKTLAETPHLAGAEPSLADFFLAPIVAYAAKTDEGAEILGSAPALADWLGRMASRPGFTAAAPPQPKQDAAE